MKTMVSVLALAAAVAAVPASAQTAPPRTPTTTLSQKSTATHRRAAASKPSRVRATGKVTTFDAPTRQLTLSTAKGNQQFTLADTTKIQDGAKSIDMASLGSLAGRSATVSYVETGGERKVQSVHVTAPKKSSAKRH